jgi:hypothetical protein
MTIAAPATRRFCKVEATTASVCGQEPAWKVNPGVMTPHWPVPSVVPISGGYLPKAPCKDAIAGKLAFEITPEAAPTVCAYRS